MHVGATHDHKPDWALFNDKMYKIMTRYLHLEFQHSSIKLIVWDELKDVDKQRILQFWDFEIHFPCPNFGKKILMT